MDEKETGIIEWIKKHKEELILGGICIGSLIVMALGLKNNNSIEKLWEDLKADIHTNYDSMKEIKIDHSDKMQTVPLEMPSINQVTCIRKNPDNSFDVNGHIRNLHSGWHASDEKMAEAEALKITLCPGQTIVDKYTKGGAAA